MAAGPPDVGTEHLALGLLIEGVPARLLRDPGTTPGPGPAAVERSRKRARGRPSGCRGRGAGAGRGGVRARDLAAETAPPGSGGSAPGGRWRSSAGRG